MFCIFHEKAFDISTFDAETESESPRPFLVPPLFLGTPALARALSLGARALGKIDEKVRKAVALEKNGKKSEWTIVDLILLQINEYRFNEN